ncbi:MAG: alpha-galactosidase [Erythrobacter sp.]|nr:alpha-galactosidase [Erythrobacter sp.]
MAEASQPIAFAFASAHGRLADWGTGMATERQFERLDGEGLTLVFALVERGGADLVYLGAPLCQGEDLAAITAAALRHSHESQPDLPPSPGVLPERKGGWGGTPAFAWSINERLVESDLRLARWEASDGAIDLHYEDRLRGVEVKQRWAIGVRGVIEARATIHNAGDRPLSLLRATSLALPIPSRFTELTTFAGRWAGEMRENRRPIAPDGFHRQSSIGKPGFAGGGWLLLHDPATGEALAAHLGWSGDPDLRLECGNSGAADGRAVLQLSAALDPGEIVLEPTEEFAAPSAFIARGSDRTGLGQNLHAFVRASILPSRSAWSPRKVHVNSWEALGFDLSQSELRELAQTAAALGAERFVLDDGWFARRRDDRTSLGDWIVSPDIFPRGLGPLIAQVQDLGMDFGLWVEPEMVSPESDLYRAHPDWCVHEAGRERPTMRSQLTLDLGRAEVRDHLFETLDALLASQPIAYLKWDHNRDLFPSQGRRYRQTEGFLKLVDRVREFHPELEIETCSSGGGRIDYGVLKRFHRVWPSDNNDAIERLAIMRAWSQFLPLEVLGSHVGPSPGPITGRRLAMDFRAKVALFGHMGVEADPRVMDESERATLAAHIALYKEWRGVLHAGRLVRLEHPDRAVHGLMVLGDQRALALAAQTGFSPTFDAAPMRLGGLEPAARYRVTLPEPWPVKAGAYLAEPDRWREGLVLSGEALMTGGLTIPLTHPETAWLIALERLAG